MKFVLFLLQAKPSKKLERVFFLNNNPNFRMSSCIINTITKGGHRSFKLANGVNFWKNNHTMNDIKDINVCVQFQADKIGSYGQEVIFDFGGFPKVVKKIGVHVETEDSLTKVKYNFFEAVYDSFSVKKIFILFKSCLVLPVYITMN